ncbi:hypothetical protein [Aeoliella sp.]|uniref:hypothetical protein n=1 Tax=Aeoliella sp. TaxID=2795800 RepID=UPI003CCB91B9
MNRSTWKTTEGHQFFQRKTASRFANYPMSSPFQDSADAIALLHGQRLSALCGQQLTEAWVAWDKDDDSWFADEPVVLTFGDLCLSIVFWKTHEVTLEWKTIDFADPPNWFGCYGELDIEWRPCEIDSIRVSIGQTLQNISLIENCETLQVLVDAKHPEDVGSQTSRWYPFALSFRFERSIMTVYNALDENGLSDEVPEADYLRATSISDWQR